jgi:trk system potassium uptake protein TrkA
MPVHVVIMGCGRVGSALAHALEDAGHEVAVIDQDERAFDRLGPQFRGRTVTGIGFDRDTLVEAGVERATAFAAVSSGDNSNIIAARVTRETFGVERVVARIYDQRRAEVYERLGIPTVATVPWATEQILRRIDPPASAEEWTDASGSVVLAQVRTHPGWVGRRLHDLEVAAGVRVAFVTRLGQGLVPEKGTALQDGDLLHVAMPRAKRAGAESVLGSEPAEARL